MRWVTCALGLLTAAAAACSDPELEVVLTFPAMPVDAVTALETDIQRYQITVAQLTSTCPDLRALRITSADVALGEVATFRASRGVDGLPPIELAGVPRLGAKLVVFTGYGDGGAVIAGGCADVGDVVDGMAPVPLPVEPAIVTRVVPSALQWPSLRLPVAAASDVVQVVARERRANGGTLASGAVTSALRTVGHDEVPYGVVIAPVTESEQANGIYTVSGLDVDPTVALRAIDPQAAPVVGPVELVIRGAWSDQVNRIAAGVKPRPIAGVAIESAGLNQRAPSWVLVDDATLPGGDPADNVVAAALYQSPSGSPQLVTVRERGHHLEALAPIGAAGIEALAAFPRVADVAPWIVGLGSDGWYALDYRTDPPTLAPVGARATSHADQVLAMPRCGAASIGLVTGDGATFTAYPDLVAAPAGDQTPIGVITAAIRSLVVPGAVIELLGSACMVVRPDVVAPVAAVRQTVGGVARVYLVTPDLPPIETPFAGAITAAEVGAGAAIVGAVDTVSGPRVRSFRLKFDAPGAGALPPRLVPDGVIDHPLPAPPRSLVTMRANPDPYYDSLALEDLGAQLGLSMTLGGPGLDDQLSAMQVNPVDGTDQRLWRVNFDSDAKDELAITSSRRVVIVDLTQADAP